MMGRIILVIALSLLGLNLSGQDNCRLAVPMTVFLNDDSSSYTYYYDSTIFLQHWSNLKQVNFWKEIMQTSPQKFILNVAATRDIIETYDAEIYFSLDHESKERFKDSIKTLFMIDSSERVFITSGKSDFFDHKGIVKLIGPAGNVFEQEGVPAWYAQSILLVENPGSKDKSRSGATGYFQLMRKVAIKFGLKVNRYVDERKDFNKSARAAAQLIRDICLPHTREMLENQNITYDETDLWFRLLVMHVYHAGAYNVNKALQTIPTVYTGPEIIKKLWSTEVGRFRNASQNYSQLILAANIRLYEYSWKNCRKVELRK